MWSDLRLARRSLQRSPIFAVTAILTLALGIGGSAAIFSAVHAVLLRPLPYRDPDRLVRIWESNPSAGRAQSPVSAANADDWRSGSRSFEDLALFSEDAEPVVLAIGEASVQARQSAVTPNLFRLLGLHPVAGREPGAASAPGGPLAPREILVSHAFWQRAFGGDPRAIGRTVRVEGVPGSVVVGVMPPGFSFPDGTELWTLIPRAPAGPARRDHRTYGAIGRLASAASVTAARSELQSVAAALERDHPGSNAGWTVVIMPLHDSVVGNHRLALTALFAAVAFVMLVGCANVSNLLLARGVARRGELAVRAALGASRARIARLLLAESLLLACTGAAAGWALAAMLLPVLVRLAGPQVPRLAEAGLNGMTLAYAVAAALVASVLTGLLPALRLSRTEVQTALGPQSERSTRLRSDASVQRVIVGGELAACLVLLVGAMLFVQTVIRLNAIDLGFDPEHVISLDARVPIHRTVARNRWQLLAADTSAALRALRSVAGVDAAAAASDVPLGGNPVATEVSLPGEARPREALYHRVSDGYFRTMGMGLVEGRDFTDGDVSDLARLPDPAAAVPRQGAVIVNETTARTYWPAGNAVGQFLSTSFDSRAISRRQVVGVVRDARSGTLRGGPPLEVYVPYLEDPSFAMTLLVRTTLQPGQIVPALRRTLREVSADVSTANIRLLDDVVGDWTRSARFNAVVIAAFAVAALMLSGLGVFGVFAFGVATRVREIGIRMALGATQPDITRLFLKEAAGPIAAGLAVGTAGALALSRLIAALLFGVSPRDVLSYAAAASILAGIALAASWWPVGRVVRTGPARALRRE